MLEDRFKDLKFTHLCLFIDSAAAFDSIDKTPLWRMMERDGVLDKIID